MRRLLYRLRDFRQKHLFLTPGECRLATVIARQVSVEELNAERERYQKAADALIECKVHFRRSAKVYKAEFSVDNAVLSQPDREKAADYIGTHIAAQILARFDSEKN